MKKILFVVPSLEVGGTISSLSSMIECLHDSYDINVLALAHEGNLNVDFKRFLLRRRFLLHAYYCTYSKSRGIGKCLILFVKLIKRLGILLNIDVEYFLCKVFSQSCWKYDYVVGFQEGGATKFVSYMRNDNKIAWIHCDYQKSSKCGLEFNLYNKFSNIICVSRYTASTFSKIYPSLRSKVQCIYNLLNTEAIQNSSTLPVDDINFITDTFTIVSIGRITKVKRFEYIPKIASSLIERGCQFKWFIIGPDSGDQSYQKLLDNIEKYNTEDYVNCLGNKFNPYPYLLKAKLLVSLSYTEACPMIFNEAKILNVPVVTTDFGSSYEFISDGESGVITTINEIDNVLFEVISNTSFYEMLKNNMAHLKYSNASIIQSLHSLFY